MYLNVIMMWSVTDFSAFIAANNCIIEQRNEKFN